MNPSLLRVRPRSSQFDSWKQQQHPLFPPREFEFPSRALQPSEESIFEQFNSCAEIKEKFDATDLEFLLPLQIEMLPDGLFDLFVNVSSLNEKRIDQTRYDFTQIQWLAQQEGCFFLNGVKDFPHPARKLNCPG